MNRMHTMLATAGLMFFLGCGPAAEAPTSDNAATTETGGDEHGNQHAGDAHSEHGGWWCGEHGVPESECGLCDSKLAAEFQRKGDWCDEHARPDSQCFECHPELEARFAARYEAKYGEAPPARTE
jgi:hypothetical protein